MPPRPGSLIAQRHSCLLRRCALLCFRHVALPLSLGEFHKDADAVKNRVSYPALGLLTGTLSAYGQTPSPTLVAQAPITAPSSGVLVTQPVAPVGVPPSGVLKTPPTVEPRPVNPLPFKKAQEVQTAKQEVQTVKRPRPVTTRLHVVHSRSAARRETITPTTTVDQNAVTPSAVSTAAEQPRNDGIGLDVFLSQFSKEKEAK